MFKCLKLNPEEERSTAGGFLPSITRHESNYHRIGSIWQCSVCGSLKKGKKARDTCKDMSCSQTRLGFKQSRSSLVRRIGNLEEVLTVKRRTIVPSLTPDSTDLLLLGSSQSVKANELTSKELRSESMMEQAWRSYGKPISVSSSSSEEELESTLCLSPKPVPKKLRFIYSTVQPDVVNLTLQDSSQESTPTGDGKEMPSGGMDIQASRMSLLTSSTDGSSGHSFLESVTNTRLEWKSKEEQLALTQLLSGSRQTRLQIPGTVTNAEWSMEPSYGDSLQFELELDSPIPGPTSSDLQDFWGVDYAPVEWKQLWDSP